MASLTEIRAALVETIAASVTGIQGYEVVPEAINVPAFVVAPRTSDFSRAFGRGQDAYSFDVIVLVSRSDDGLAQAALDPFVNGFGSSSIRQAIWNSRDLGVDVEATVTGMSDYGAQFTFGATDYLGARLAVDVLTSGTA